MALEIEGKVKKILPELKGQGKNGEWKKQEFVIETGGEYPKLICFNTWGEKTSSVKNLQIGESVKVSFEVSSREYQEKYFTEVRAWKIEKLGARPAGENQPAQTQSSQQAPSQSFDDSAATEADDLPF